MTGQLLPLAGKLFTEIAHRKTVYRQARCDSRITLTHDTVTTAALRIENTTIDRP
jgi:hypothetical protein